MVHKQAAQRTHAIAPSVHEEGRHRACKCRVAAPGASGGTVPVATDPVHLLRPVVISASTVVSGALGCPLAPWISPQSACCVVIGAITARSDAPGCHWMIAEAQCCSRTWSLDDPPLLSSCFHAAPMCGKPMRKNRRWQRQTNHEVASAQLARRGEARVADHVAHHAWLFFRGIFFPCTNPNSTKGSPSRAGIAAPKRAAAVRPQGARGEREPRRPTAAPLREPPDPVGSSGSSSPVGRRA